MTTQKDIEDVLMRGANILLRTLDTVRYKDYLLPIFFFKYLNDFYLDEIERIGQQYQDGLILKHEKYYFPFIIAKETSFKKLSEQQNNQNLGQLINTTLRKIENDNIHQLAGVFSRVDYSSETRLGNEEHWNAILRGLLEIFGRLDLRPSQIEVKEKQIPADVIGDTISSFASIAGKGDGFFCTPAAVSEIITRIVNVQNGERIYDPACGSGSLIIRAAKHRDNNRVSIYGQEINASLVSIAKMNMLIHQINDARIVWGDTLVNPLFLDAKGNLMLFDVIVANAPFFTGSRKTTGRSGKETKLNAPMDKYHRFDWGVPPVNKSDWAFLLHMIASCAPKGRIAAVTPYGVLFRSGAESDIRKQVIDENLLDAVIGLPENIFMETHIHTCILIFKKDRQDKDVVFIDASKEDETGKPRYVKGKGQNILEEKHINDIVLAYQKRKNIARFVHVASLKEIIENDYNLNVHHYVDTFGEEEIVDIEEVRRNLKRLKMEIARTETEMDGYLKELGL